MRRTVHARYRRWGLVTGLNVESGTAGVQRPWRFFFDNGASEYVHVSPEPGMPGHILPVTIPDLNTTETVDTAF